MDMSRFRLNSIAAALHHNGRLANPFDPFSIAIKAITSKPAKKKTEDDALTLYWLEWSGGLYCDPPVRTPAEAESAIVTPVAPAANIHSFLNDGARFNRKGADILRGVVVSSGPSPILLSGWPAKKTLRQIFESGEFTDIRSVVMPSGGRTMRCRPIFRQWMCEFTLAIDPEIISLDDVATAVDRAARYTGLFDGKPLYGRCTAERLDGRAAEDEAA